MSNEKAAERHAIETIVIPEALPIEICTICAICGKSIPIGRYEPTPLICSECKTRLIEILYKKNS